MMDTPQRKIYRVRSFIAEEEETSDNFLFDDSFDISNSLDSHGALCWMRAEQCDVYTDAVVLMPIVRFLVNGRRIALISLVLFAL